jgi:hypothetical protein
MEEQQMKIQKLYVSLATACLLVGVSGAAMAQEEPPPTPVVDTCDDGSIWLTAVDEIVVDGRSCAILDVLVTGNVTATGGSTISLISSRVGGDVTVTGAGNAIIVNNQLYNGVLRVEGNQTAIVQANNVDRGSRNNSDIEDTTPGGSILVNQNQDATVQGNTVGRNIQCQGNGSLQSAGNIANGIDACP